MNPRFSDWLSTTAVSPATVSTKCPDLRRLEREYGDLNPHWQDDRCKFIFAELKYSAADEKANQPNPSRLKFNGDFRRNLGHFKSCLNSYAQFKQEVASELPEALEAASGDPATKGLTFPSAAQLFRDSPKARPGPCATSLRCL